MDGFTVVFLGTCACDFSPRLQTDGKDRWTMISKIVEDFD